MRGKQQLATPAVMAVNPPSQHPCSLTLRCWLCRHAAPQMTSPCTQSSRSNEQKVAELSNAPRFLIFLSWLVGTDGSNKPGLFAKGFM